MEPEVLRNLIVNYIPTTVDETQLRQLFDHYGAIESIKIVQNRETRQSRGFGFIKYQYAYSAANAIQYLGGYPLMNKRLKVAYAKDQEAQATLGQMYNNPVMTYGNMMMVPGQPQPQPQLQQQQPGAGQPRPNGAAPAARRPAPPQGQVGAAPQPQVAPQSQPTPQQ